MAVRRFISGAVSRLWLCTVLGVFGAAGNAFAATYYIDWVSGSDANSGTSRVTPWKVHPYMKGFAGTYTHQAGDRFIFKGGVTWPLAAFPLVPVSGGTVASPDYYGVDQTWFTGASWTRPIFDPNFVVVPALRGSDGSIIFVDGVANSNITFDNLEIRHLLASAVNGGFGQGSIHVSSNATNIMATNCYIHGWDTLATTDEHHGGFIAVNSGVTIVDHSEIHNAEFNDPTNPLFIRAKANGHCARGVDEVRFSILHDAPNTIIGSVRVHDNIIYNINFPTFDFDTGAHSNGAYVLGDPSGAPSLVYNNLMYNSNSGTNMYLNPCAGGPGPLDSTFYFYNNVVILRSSTGAWAVGIDPEFGSGQCGTVYVWNNTLQTDDANLAPLLGAGCRPTSCIKNVAVRNNHFISAPPMNGGDVGAPGGYPVSFTGLTTLVMDHSVFMTNVVANAQGYTPGNNYAPTSATNSTVGVGVNLSSVFTTDIKRVVRTPPWDVGAYQFTGARPAPPTNLTGVPR